jgi:serine/threonine protein kinase
MCENKKLLKIIKKSLSINPSDRYSSAEEMFKALDKVRRHLKK